MAVTLAFDVYGTLIDTQGVLVKLVEIIPDKAQQFSGVWREKQLEYSFRRGLMQNYENFSVCTKDALDFSCQFLDVCISDEQKNQLLNSYRTLPAFADVECALEQLKSAGFCLYAFSNGSSDAVEELLNNAGIRDYFKGVVSVDDIKTYKPNPAVYKHFLRQSGATERSALLISSNPFDVIGAISAGLQAVWLQRNQEAIFDPWGIEPTLKINSLSDLQKSLHMFGVSND
jgi:2-haloacid dehalogenase